MITKEWGVKVVAIQVGSGEFGTDIVTLEDKYGQLSRALSKQVSKDLLDEFKGKVFNNRDANN